MPVESHGQRSLESYSPWDRKERDTTEPLNNNNNSYSENLGGMNFKDSNSLSLCFFFLFKLPYSFPNKTVTNR